MSSCLSGGAAAAYGFELEMMKSPSPRAASALHNTPSPSSTISESTSPSLSISTRKPRTRRKRPNQTYDEAAALLSTAYPNIFSSKRKTLSNPLFLEDTIKCPLSELMMPFELMEETNFPVQVKSDNILEYKEAKLGDDSEVTRFGFLDDFDAESILDEEVEEGIDSFMGRINDRDNHRNGFSDSRLGEIISAGKFRLELGLRSSLREENDDWFRFPTVEFEQISPRIQVAGDSREDKKTSTTAKRSKKKKKNKVSPPPSTTSPAAEVKSSELSSSKLEQSASPMLSLNYEKVLEAWADKESPFSDEILGSDAAGIDFHAKLGEIDLFGDDGMRKASVLRYKEKRRNRLSSNSEKIRYQVRKLNADQRPRMKGRFVRRSNVRNLSWDTII